MIQDNKIWLNNVMVQIQSMPIEDLCENKRFRDEVADECYKRGVEIYTKLVWS